VGDVLLSAIINNAFWLVLFIVTVVLFRPQIQALIASIGSFSVAGGVFEFKGDQRATLESYTILTNILIEMLSEGGSANPLMDLISAASARPSCLLKAASLGISPSFSALLNWPGHHARRMGS